jgi:hypothetical protein
MYQEIQVMYTQVVVMQQNMLLATGHLMHISVMGGGGMSDGIVATTQSF